MLILTAQRADGTVDVLIALARENIERIREYDPAEVIWSQLPAYAQTKPHAIAITYMTAKDEAEIERMSSTGEVDWKAKAFRMLTRGFRFRPESGDHDFGPIMLGESTKGTKN